MPVPDVIREQRRLRLASRRDDEHRLGLLDNRHDQALRVEHEAVAGPQDGATRQGGAELDAAIGSSSSVHVRALFPSERDRVAPEPAARIGQIALADDAFDDGHMRSEERRVGKEWRAGGGGYSGSTKRWAETDS